MLLVPLWEQRREEAVLCWRAGLSQSPWMRQASPSEDELLRQAPTRPSATSLPCPCPTQLPGLPPRARYQSATLSLLF